MPTQSFGMDISKQASRLRRDVTSGPEVPPWWGLLQVALVVGFMLFLLYSAATSFSSSSGASSASAPTFAGGSGEAAAPSAPAEDDGAPDPQPSDSEQSEQQPDAEASAGETGPQVPVNLRDGGTADVDAAAVDLAHLFAEGLFTGSFADVAFTAATAAPSLPVTFANPQRTDTSIVERDAARITFAVQIDPDPTGPTPVREVRVVVVREDGTWRAVGS